jgi:hypothetical protein
MRRGRHGRRRVRPRSHPAGYRKKPPPPRRGRRGTFVPLADAAEALADWFADFEEMVERENERDRWEEERKRLRRQREASNEKRKRL